MRTVAEHLSHHASLTYRKGVYRADDEIHAKGARKAAEVLESEHGGSHPGPHAVADDPPVSEAQRRAMWAAASGKGNIGIPKSVGEEFAEKDPGGKLPEKAHDAVAGEIATSPTGMTVTQGRRAGT